jgi:hypothetical protein
VTLRGFFPGKALCPTTRVDVWRASLAKLGYELVAQFDPTATVVRV